MIPDISKLLWTDLIWKERQFEVLLDKPITAPRTEGIPNFCKISISYSFLMIKKLNVLFKKCTASVRPTAASKGKNSANTGRRTVPSPNPEKKMIQEVKKAASARMRISTAHLF